MYLNIIYTHCPLDPPGVLPTYVPSNFMSSFLKKSAIFYLISSFLRILHMHTMKYDHIYPLFIPPTFFGWIPSKWASLNMMSSLFFFKNQLSPVSTAHTFMYVGPSTGAWEIYQ